MLVAHLQAENVARQVECADLAAAVVQDLVGADRAADDLVEVLGRLVLAVDFDIAAEAYCHAHQFDRTVSGVDAAPPRYRAHRDCLPGLRPLGIAVWVNMPHSSVSMSNGYREARGLKIQILTLGEIPEVPGRMDRGARPA